MFELQVDPASSEPIFEQIAFQVKGAVARGDLGSGDKLPSVRELARELVVNPNTVVRAYQHLEQDGVIVRKRGSGCFIREGGTKLSDDARSAELDELARRTVTEAYHLGFRPDEIRRAVDGAIKELRFPRGRKKS